MCSIILYGTALKLAAQDQTMQICKVAHLSNVSVKMQVIIYSKCYILHSTACSQLMLRITLHLDDHLKKNC